MYGDQSGELVCWYIPVPVPGYSSIRWPCEHRVAFSNWSSTNAAKPTFACVLQFCLIEMFNKFAT